MNPLDTKIERWEGMSEIAPPPGEIEYHATFYIDKRGFETRTPFGVRFTASSDASREELLDKANAARLAMLGVKQ